VIVSTGQEDGGEDRQRIQHMQRRHDDERRQQDRHPQAHHGKVKGMTIASIKDDDLQWSAGACRGTRAATERSPDSYWRAVRVRRSGAGSAAAELARIRSEGDSISSRAGPPYHRFGWAGTPAR